MKDQPFHQITINQIIKIAKISRRTFYVHYHDKEEVLTEIEEQILHQFQLALRNEISELKPVHNFTDPQLVTNTNQTFEHILTLINHQRSQFKILLAETNDGEFYRRFKSLLEKQINQRLIRYNATTNDNIPAEYVNTILIGNLIDLIKIWLLKEHPEDPCTFAQILTKSRMMAPLELIEFHSIN